MKHIVHFSHIYRLRDWGPPKWWRLLAVAQSETLPWSATAGSFNYGLCIAFASCTPMWSLMVKRCA